MTAARNGELVSKMNGHDDVDWSARARVKYLGIDSWKEDFEHSI